MATGENKLQIILEGVGIKATEEKIRVLYELLKRAPNTSFEALSAQIKGVAKDMGIAQKQAQAYLSEFDKAGKNLSGRQTIANKRGQPSKKEFKEGINDVQVQAKIKIDPVAEKRKIEQSFASLAPVKVNTNLKEQIPQDITGLKGVGGIKDPALRLKTIKAVQVELTREHKLMQKSAIPIKEKVALTKKYQTVLGDLQSSLLQISRVESKNRGFSDRDISKVQRYNRQHQELAARSKEANRALKTQENTTDRLTGKNKALSGSLDTAIGKLIRYRVAFFAMRGIIDGVKDSIQTFVDVQFKIAELSIVVDRQTTSVEELRKAAFGLGNEFGGEVKEIIDAMKIWAQTGLDQQQILDATRATLIGVNILGGTTKEVTESLTAAIFTYGIEVENVTDIISKWLAVQREFPISAKDLAASLKVVGAAAKVVGVDLDDLSGYVAAIGSITRKSGSAIGQSLKTMFARLPRKEVISAFEGIGVAVLGTSNKIRDLDNVLKELSGKWKDLSSVQKSNLAVTFGGIRRYADFIALMDNYELKLAATIISQRASTEAIEANQIVLGTFQKDWEQTKVAMSEFGFEVGILLSGPLGDLIGVLRSLITDSDGTAKALARNIAQFAAFAAAAGSTFIAITGLKFVVVKLATSLGIFWTQMKIAAAGSLTASKIFKFTTADLRAMAGALFTVQGAMAAFNIVLAALTIAAGIWAVISLNATESVRNFGEALDESSGDKAIQRFRKSKDEIKALRLELQALEDAPGKLENIVSDITDVGKSAGESKQSLELFKSISKGLGTISGELGAALNTVALSFDGESRSLVEVNKLIDENIAKKKEQLGVSIKVSEQNKERAVFNIRESLAEQKSINEGALAWKKYAEAVSKVGEEVAEDSAFKGMQKVVEATRRSQELKEAFKAQFGTDTFDFLEKELGEVGSAKLKSGINKVILTAGDSISRLLKILNELNAGDSIDTSFFIGKKLSKEVLSFNKTLEAATGKFANTILSIRNSIQEAFPLTESEFISLFPQDTNVVGIFQAELDELVLQTKRLKFDELLDPEIFKVKAADTFLKTTDDLMLKLQTQIINADENVANLEKAQEALLAAEEKLGSNDIGPQLFGVDEDISKKLKQEAEKIFSFLDADIRNALLESENIPRSLSNLFNENVKTTQELRKEFDALTESEKRAFAVQILSNYVRKQEDVYWNQVRISSQSQIQISALKQQVGVLALFPRKLKEQFALEKKIADLNYATSLAIARTKIDDQEVLNDSIKATNQYLKETLKIQDSLTKTKLNKIYAEVAENAKIIKDSLSGAFGNIPDTITDGFEQRQEISQELKDAEKELQEVRLAGDSQAIADAEHRVKVVKAELDEYKAGWYEIRSIVVDVFGNISNKVWKKFSDRVAEDIANITIGGETIGDSVGSAITNTTNSFVDKWDVVVTRINLNHQTALQAIHREHERRLRAIRDEPKLLADAEGSFQAGDLNVADFAFENMFPDLGKTTKADKGIIIPEDADTKDNTKALNGLGALLAVSAGQAGSAAITGPGTGQQAGSTIGGLAGMYFGGPIGAGVGSLLGGLVGGIFDSKPDEPEKDTAIRNNTEAVLNNTVALKELDKAIFNAPTGFNVNPRSGGGFSGSIAININSNGDPTDIANEVISVINEQLDNDASSSGTRGFSPN